MAKAKRFTLSPRGARRLKQVVNDVERKPVQNQATERIPSPLALPLMPGKPSAAIADGASGTVYRFDDATSFLSNTPGTRTVTAWNASGASIEAGKRVVMFRWQSRWWIIQQMCT